MKAIAAREAAGEVRARATELSGDVAATQKVQEGVSGGSIAGIIAAGVLGMAALANFL